MAASLQCPPLQCSSLRLRSSPSALRQQIRPGACRPTVRRSRVPASPRASDPKDSNSTEEWRPPSDWDKAWKTYKKVGSSPASGLGKGGSGGLASGKSGLGWGRSSSLPWAHMEQYVSRSPSRSDYPLSEEVDPVRRTERAALDAWTDTRVTAAGVGVVALMFVYMVVVVGPPPS